MRSATAVSRPVRCRRTSSSATTPWRWPTSSPRSPARRSSSRLGRAPRRTRTARPRTSRMLDLRAIARDPEPVRAALARRRDGSEERLLEALAARERLNAARPEFEDLQAKRNAGAKAIGDAKRTGADASEAIAEMQLVSARVKELQTEIDELEQRVNGLNVTLPNPPDPSAADEDAPLRE